jgi:hypothetical protein
MQIVARIFVAIMAASWAVIQFWYIGPLSASYKMSFINFALHAVDICIILGLAKWFSKKKSQNP